MEDFRNDETTGGTMLLLLSRLWLLNFPQVIKEKSKSEGISNQRRGPETEENGEMAEARSDEEEENVMRDSREQVVRRQPNSSGGKTETLS